MAEAVCMKKVKRNIKVKRCVGKCMGKSYWETEAVVWRCPVKKVLFEILQNSPDNNCAWALFWWTFQLCTISAETSSKIFDRALNMPLASINICFHSFINQKPNCIITYSCKLKVRFLKSTKTSFLDFSETINRGIFRTLSNNKDQVLCENS